MRYHRTDVVEQAIEVLDRFGLPDMSMRRIATELGLQPSALYHHFANKQALLAAVSDEILRRGSRADDESLPWRERALRRCHVARDAMLAYRDGAELVATVHAFGLGTRLPLDGLAQILVAAGLEAEVAGDAANTVLYFVLGHVSEEQVALQASSAGAVDHAGLDRLPDGSFDRGLGILMDGIALRAVAPA